MVPPFNEAKNVAAVHSRIVSRPSPQGGALATEVAEVDDGAATPRSPPRRTAPDSLDIQSSRCRALRQGGGALAGLDRPARASCSWTATASIAGAGRAPRGPLADDGQDVIHQGTWRTTRLRRLGVKVFTA
jgi:hypothetical protein